MNLSEIKVKITFTEEILGSGSNNPDLHGEYIASKGPDAMTLAEEVECYGLDETIEKGMTVFPRDTETGERFCWDYQIRGFFKEACGVLKKIKGSKSEKIAAYKKVIDGMIFVKERKIPFVFDGAVGECQRPLRAQTAQGERIALAHSETIPAGATLEFTIQTLDEKYIDAIREWLDYGILKGLGQWRNSGKGRFTWEEITE